MVTDKLYVLYLAINLLLTVILSINLVLSNPWSVGLGRQEHAQRKLWSARIANEPPDLIFRGKGKNGLGTENKTQESIPLVTGPQLALRPTRFSAMPVGSGFLPQQMIWGLAKTEIQFFSYFVSVPICCAMLLRETIQWILNQWGGKSTENKIIPRKDYRNMAR